MVIVKPGEFHLPLELCGAPKKYKCQGDQFVQNLLNNMSILAFHEGLEQFPLFSTNAFFLKVAI